jgi:hypothetical protein
MAQCKKCLDFYSDKREAIGYDTCLQCGSTDSAREIARRTRCVAPAFNKGAYQYVTSSAAAKDVGR